MEFDSLEHFRHQHVFGNDRRQPGEGRTLLVVLLTITTMVVEIVAGLWFGSMALLADGLHMGSHAAALTVAVLAYAITRRHAHDRRFSFGTGKVNALGGFTGAILLVVFALMMAWESVMRMFYPTPISFNQALVVALLGLMVNAVSALILREDGESREEQWEAIECGTVQGPDVSRSRQGHDHNRRAAFFHVVADALTSVLAIVALLSAKYLGWLWMDPFMGIVGAALITHWSVGLLRSTGSVLLDHQGPPALENAIRNCVESRGDCHVADLHLWAIGPGIYALELVVVARQPRTPDFYKSLLPANLGLVHVTVEVHGTQRAETVREKQQTSVSSD